ncbi:MAG: hypothetical protein KME32_32210 [Mojavia pulchra JT2-VF2]|jgi:hypothetical protein|uniref:Uncharacterized protein n=1 Tax=Mojavia pulchra JT2-VF2 TaxID=287848 RepID=A0A951UK24_9NOST|nr:hypothetical protein [Mojavia pulchra JT2-VF2]
MDYFDRCNPLYLKDGGRSISLGLQKPRNQMLFERVGRPEYGAIAQTFSDKGSFDVQLSNKQIGI